jgi:hypothetical protein
MFNLDQAIAQWRQQMLKAGLKSPVPLDELESHLRDDIQEQMRSGVSVKQAFEVATRRIGEAHALKSEFAKARKAPKAFRKLMGFACVVLVGFIFLLSGFTFSQMRLSPGEQILAYAAVAFTLVAACGWRFAVPFLPVIPNKRKRVAVGSACILFGFLCTSLFTNFVLPHFERNHDGQIPAVGFWAVFPIAVFAGLGLGLAMSARDREYWEMEKAAGRTTAPADT